MLEEKSFNDDITQTRRASDAISFMTEKLSLNWFISSAIYSCLFRMRIQMSTWPRFWQGVYLRWMVGGLLRRRTEIWRCRAVNWARLPFGNDSHLLRPAFTAERLITNGLSGAFFLLLSTSQSQQKLELLLGRQKRSTPLVWKVGEGRGAEGCLVSSNHRREGGQNLGIDDIYLQKKAWERKAGL